jgi:hypothetical protein
LQRAVVHESSAMEPIAIVGHSSLCGYQEGTGKTRPRHTPPVAEPIQMSPVLSSGFGTTTLMRPVALFRCSPYVCASSIRSGPCGYQLDPVMGSATLAVGSLASPASGGAQAAPETHDEEMTTIAYRLLRIAAASPRERRLRWLVNAASTSRGYA